MASSQQEHSPLRKLSSAHSHTDSFLVLFFLSSDYIINYFARSELNVPSSNIRWLLRPRDGYGGSRHEVSLLLQDLDDLEEIQLSSPQKKEIMGSLYWFRFTNQVHCLIHHPYYSPQGFFVDSREGRGGREDTRLRKSAQVCAASFAYS